MQTEEINLNWCGMLTVENIKQVVEVLRQLLSGKKFTFVICDEGRGFEPEVRTGQQLKPSTKDNSINVYYDEEKNFAGFNVCDSYGVWGCSTNLHANEYDPEFKNPYLAFEHNRVTITHRAPSRSKLYCVCAIEKE